MEHPGDRPSHVAVLPFPITSHALSLLSLVGKFAEAAPAATFSFFSTAKCIAATAKVLEGVGNVKFHEVWDGVPEGYVLNGRPEEAVGLFLEAMPRNFVEGLRKAEEGEGRKVTMVVSDSFVWSAGELAEEMGVPWVSVWDSSAVALAAHLYTDEIRETIGVRPEEISAKMDDPLDFVPGLTQVRPRDLQVGILVGDFNSTFAKMLKRMAETSRRSDVILINSFDGLEPVVIDHLKTIYSKTLTVAPHSLLTPLPSPDLHGCLDWLDHLEPTPSVVYISFGSIFLPPPHELAAIAEALEASGTPFLWSLKEHLFASLPAGFFERTKGRGLIVPWAPQVAVLGHPTMGAFVTHCGWNSVVESIVEGVPMICRPVFADHKLNCRMVSHVWGIGVEAEGGVLTKDGILRALDLILVREEGRKMRERAKALKEMAREAASEGGSSRKNFMSILEIVSGAGK